MGKKWVRVFAPKDIPIAIVRQELEVELGRPLTEVAVERRHMVVSCATDKEVRQLLDLDGAKFDGQPIKIQRAEYSMSGDDMLSWVGKLLESQEELETLRRTYGCDSPPRSREEEGLIRVVGDSKPSPSGSSNSQPRKGQKGGGNRKGGNQGSTDGGRGRPADQRETPPQAGSAAASGQTKGSDANECWTCKKLNLSADHDFRTCEKSRQRWAEKQARKKEEGNGSRPVSPRSEKQ